MVCYRDEVRNVGLELGGKEGKVKIPSYATCFPGWSVLQILKESLLELDTGIIGRVRKKSWRGRSV